MTEADTAGIIQGCDKKPPETIQHITAGCKGQGRASVIDVAAPTAGAVTKERRKVAEDVGVNTSLW